MTQDKEDRVAVAPDDDVSPDQPAGQGLGEVLRLAREERSMSLEQVSEALHLDENVILALEQERFEMFGAPVFVRGHLKAYAQLLGLSADAIVDRYQDSSPEPIPAATLQQPGVAAVTINPVLWGSGALAVLLGLLLGIYVLLGDDEVDEPMADAADVAGSVVEALVERAPVPVVVEIEKAVLPLDVPQRVAAPAPEPPVREVAVEPEIVEFVEAAPMAPRPAAPMRLSLQFRQESWVEISDANRRLLFGLQREGNRREITGEPPFNLLIGNARGVELTINDEPFDVPVSRVRGKVARFEITGDEFE